MKKRLLGQAKNGKMNVPRMLESLHCIYCQIKSDPVMNEVAQHVLHAEELLRQVQVIAVAVAREAGGGSGQAAEKDDARDRYLLDDSTVPLSGHSRFRYH